MTFAEAVREILVESSTAPERPTPGNLAERISRQAEKYLDRVRFDPAQYVRHPVLLWDDWEVMIIGWESGQVTPVHDHRGVLGGMAMLSGSLLEERFTTPGLVPQLADSRVRPEGDQGIRGIWYGSARRRVVTSLLTQRGGYCGSSGRSSGRAPGC